MRLVRKLSSNFAADLTLEYNLVSISLAVFLLCEVRYVSSSCASFVL